MKKKRTALYRICVAVGFGLLGFFVNFLDITLMESPDFKISILAGLFFPLLVTLAWGWRWGLLSALAGGCQTMWWLWRSDGWGMVYAVPVFTLWVVWHGFWADRRKDEHPWYQSSFFVEIPFRAAVEIGFYTLFRRLVSYNPPPWNPAIVWNEVQLSWMHTVALKHTLTGYLLLLVCYLLLNLGPVRRFFGLERRLSQRDTAVICGIAVLVGVLIWFIDALIDYFIFFRGGFLDLLIRNVPPHEMYIRLLILASFTAFGIIIARIARYRALMGERLDHINRLLSSVRNINQIITHTKEKTALLNSTCRLLIETRGFHNAWIALVRDGRPVEPVFHAGFGCEFESMADSLREGKLPACAVRAMKTGGVIVLHDPASECTGCPLSGNYEDRAGLTVRIEHSGNIFGWLTVSTPRRYANDEDEHGLLTEVAGDIGFALWSAESEKRLETMEKKYAYVLSSTSDAVVAADLEGTITLFNLGAERLFGLSAEEAVGSSVSRLCPEDLRDEQASLIKKVVSSGTVQGFETERVTADGRRIPVEMTLSLLTDDRNRPTGINAILHDIIQRKEAENALHTYQEQLENMVEERTAELKAVNRELESFAYSVSHDLRAPLRAIDGFSEILLEEYASALDEEGKRLGSVIRRNTQKMGRLIDDLLAFSRMGRTDMKATRIDMKDMAVAVYHEITSPEERRKIDFTVGDIPPAAGDTTMMRQVWTNLISNAVKFSSGRERPVIGVTAREKDGFLLYRVQDNGAGFNMKYRDKLFGIFQRLHSEKEFEGTGVGLALVQRIVHRHDGKVEAEGEVDGGAAFSFSLPKKPL